MIRAFDGVTVSGKQGGGGGLTGKGIWIYDASTLISNSHVEYFYDGIYIGGGTGLTQDVQIVNTSIGSNQGGYDVTIDADASDIMLVGITTSSTRVLNDVPMSRTLGASDNSLGFYAIGDNTACAPSCVVAPSSFSSSRYADWFIPTNLTVHGSLTKGSGTFKIDHPLDPENKYLSHSFVESPDMMNIYNGITITDEHGSATVAMPEYFSALNRDFKYQLTVLGQFAQAIVAEKITGNHFTVKTDKPRVEVSWQVTGIRQDAFANAHRVVVEEDKPPRERGHYLYPELFQKRNRVTAANQSSK